MKRKIFLTFILIIISQIAQSQLSVEIKSNHGNDTVITCADTTIQFVAIVTKGSDTITSGITYVWDFDDGTVETDTNLDTIEHSFIDRAGYRVMLTVTYDTLKCFNILPVKLGLDPIFEDTKTDIPENQEGICDSDKVIITGDVKEFEWKEERQTIRTEVFPLYIDDSHQYSSYITRKDFNVSDVLVNATDIDSIGIKIEHSNTATVKISLTCPTGKTIVLKDTGGVQKCFGEPITAPGDYSEGTGYWYYWSNSPQYSSMNTFSGADTLPAGTYTPDNPFDGLAGCPLDGNWTLTVEDKQADTNDGYVFAWALIFNENIEADTFKYVNSYDLTGSVWTGDNANISSNGVVDVRPAGEGQHKYNFYVRDNLGCLHDTSIFINVEKPTLNIDKTSLSIGDSIHVENQTSWSVSQEWDFGDNSEIITDKDVYKKYEDKGTYLVKMTVESASGCKDFDTVEVSVTPIPIEITEYNIFSPNGDGVNDIFSFFNTPDEKIVAANIEDITGTIFNRYGEVVCKWTTPEEAVAGWDGTIRNNGGIRHSPPGFYYYVLIIKGKDGIKYKFNGTIYLYRSK